MAMKFIVLMAVFLSACSPTSEIPNETGFKLSSELSYSIYSPMSFDNKYVRSDGSISWTNFEAPKSTLDEKDVLLEIYNLDTTCSPSLTGVSDAIHLDNDKSWGRVNFFDGDAYLYDPNPAPLCAPPRYREGTNPTAYAFCAEKNGKTVLICISQMTDNSELAEEIFGTFRWTN